MSYTKHFPDGILHVRKTEKNCTKCGITKLIDDFRKKPSALDGRNSECIECSRTAYKLQMAKRAEGIINVF